MDAEAFETITVADTAIGFTAATITSASEGEMNFAFCGPLETASVRWRDDGTAPTSSVGHLIEIGGVLEYDGDLSDIKFIRTGAQSASLPVSYYRRG